MGRHRPDARPIDSLAQAAGDRSAPDIAGVFRLERHRQRAMTITPDMAEIFGTTLRRLRSIDDQEGGNPPNIHFVTNQLNEINEYLNQADIPDSSVYRQLVRTSAELNQLAGWMALDAEKHRLARMHFNAGLQGAELVNESALHAHILGFMAYQAAYQRRAKKALALAIRARAAAHDAPLTVQSLLAAREAMARAVAGEVAKMEEAIAESRQLVARPGALETRPSWLYWWDSQNAEYEAAFIVLHMPAAKTRYQLALLDEAERSLAPFISPENVARQRDALYHSVRSSQMWLRRDDVDQSLRAGRYALRGVHSLRHARSVTQLRCLSSALRSRPKLCNNTEVRAFHEELRETLGD